MIVNASNHYNQQSKMDDHNGHGPVTEHNHQDTKDAGDHGTNGGGDGDDVSIREDMVKSAINFLLHPNIQGIEIDKMKEFLSRKGLKLIEIDMAVQRAQEQRSGHHIQNIWEARSNELTPLGHGYPYSYSQPSFWLMTRSMTTSFAVICGCIYSIHWFYRAYIQPLFNGNRNTKSDLDILKEQISSLTDSVNMLRGNLIDLEMNLRRDLPNIFSNLRVGNEIESELISIKSLLLNKNEFPLKKTLNGQNIPEWQMEVNKDEPKNKEIQDSSSVNGII